jgi:DNA-binding MarR family transcriptional regulator
MWKARAIAAFELFRFTEKGRRVFVPIFRQHAALVERAFQDVSPEEQGQIEEVLERIAKRAEELGEQEGHR